MIMSLFSSIIGEASSLLGGLASSGISANQASINRKFQAGENQKNRDFNHAEAQLARQFQERMWNANNAYNTPKATMQRLVDAGINPAMYYSQGTGIQAAQLSSGSPQASYSSGVSGAMPDTSGIQHAGDAYNISRLNEAQAKNLDNDSEIKRIDSLTRDAQNRTNISVGHSVVNYNCSLTNLSDEQAREVGVNINKQQKLIEQIDVEIDNSLKQGKLLDYDILFRKETFSTSVEQFKDYAKITHEQARAIIQTLAADIISKQMNAWLAYNQASLTPYQAKVLQAQAFHLEKLGENVEIDTQNKQWLNWLMGRTYVTEVKAKNAQNQAIADYSELMMQIQIVGQIFQELAGAAGMFMFGKGALNLLKAGKP